MTAATDRSDVPELRLALAMNGGVSLAVWIGGVCDEVLRLHRQGRATDLDVRAGEIPAAATPYQLACWLAGLQPRVDVLAGASAGGMNSVFLALALLHRRDDLASLRALWVDVASFEALIRPPRDADLSSLMMGDGYFLPQLQEAIGDLLPDGAVVDPAVRLTVLLTATSLRGHRRRIDHTNGETEREKSHHVLLRFCHDPRDPARSDFAPSPPARDRDAPLDMRSRDRVVARLARACRSTASFPGAFEPSAVTVARTTTGTPPPVDALLPRHYDLPSGVSVPDGDLLIDGGTLVNLPVDAALSAIFAQRSDGPVRRVFATVVPDPSTDESEPDHRAPAGLAEVVTGALSSIPRNESVGDAFDVVEERNLAVEAMWAARSGLLDQELDHLEDAAQRLFGAYAARRSLVSAAHFRKHLVARFETAVLSDADRRGWLACTTALHSAAIPTELTGYADEQLRGWGRSTVRRSAARVLTIVKDLERQEVSEATGAARRLVMTVIDEVGEVTTPDAANLFERLELTATTADDRTAALQGCVDAAQAGLAAVPGQLRRLGACVAALQGRAPGAAGRVTTELDGLRLLLALEVVEQSFGGFEHVVEQRIETMRLDGLCTSPLDPLQRSRPAQKVAGVQLGHFGSFLKSTWRANDWMWGRLDGAHDLIDVLLAAAPLARLRAAAPGLGIAAETAGAMADDELRAAVARELCARVHATIVLEEAVTMRRAIAADADLGVRELGTTKQLRAAIDEALAAEPTASGAERRELATRVLRANRVGEERLADYSGSDLVLRVGAQTLSTGAGVLQAAAPSVGKGPIGAVRYVALVLWAFVKGALGGPVGRTIAGIAFGLGAGLIAVRLFADADLAFLFPIGLALLTAGVVLGMARAPSTAVPLLALGIVPFALWKLPAARASWWPSGVGWPSLHDRWAGIPVLCFAFAVFGFGVVPTPGWWRPVQRDVAGARRQLARLTGRPAGATPAVDDHRSRPVRVAAAVGLRGLFPRVLGVDARDVVEAVAAAAVVALAGLSAWWSPDDARVLKALSAAVVGVAGAVWVVVEWRARRAAPSIGARPHGPVWTLLPFLETVSVCSLVAAITVPRHGHLDVSWTVGTGGALLAGVVLVEGALLAALLAVRSVPAPRVLATVALAVVLTAVAAWRGMRAAADDTTAQHAVQLALVFLAACPAAVALRVHRYASRSLLGPLLTTAGAVLALAQWFPR